MPPSQFVCSGQSYGTVTPGVPDLSPSATHSSLAGDSDLPDHHVQGTILLLLRAGVEALRFELAHIAIGLLTKGWSLRHCLRSSVSRAVARDDWESAEVTAQIISLRTILAFSYFV